MNNNRPMSEHEAALFDAVLAIAATLLETGADREALKARLIKARDATEALGNRHGAATLNFLMDGLFPPSAPPPKPSFRIV